MPLAVLAQRRQVRRNAHVVALRYQRQLGVRRQRQVFPPCLDIVGQRCRHVAERRAWRCCLGAKQLHRRTVDQPYRVAAVNDDNALAQVLDDVLIEF